MDIQAVMLQKIFDGSLNLEKCTVEELRDLPLIFYQTRVDSTTLLNIWGKLPFHYRKDFLLRTSLPCFVHYNRPDSRIHVDGPPSPQGQCRHCLESLPKTNVCRKK